VLRGENTSEDACATRTAHLMGGPIETRRQALDFLGSRINYERSSGREYSAGGFKLQRMRRLLNLLDDPQDRLPAIHIAGTKGKGSTAVMIAEMLSAAGYRTGLFTSPHVNEFEERMRVDGSGPSESELASLLNAVIEPVTEMERSPDSMSPTYFEIATAMAWLYFVRKEAEFVVLEVGLGGRLDATNICSPVASVITNISRDHTAVLGNRLAQIASEKGGIVKSGIPVFSGVSGHEAQSVVEEICRVRGARLYELGRDFRLSGRSVCRRRESGNRQADSLRCAQLVDVSTPWRTWSDVPLPLAGEHQAQNAAVSLAVVDLLDHLGRRVSASAVHRGMARLEWPLRIEVLSEQPTVVVDAAHNTASAAALIRTLNEEFEARQRILVFAVTGDKDIAGLLRQLVPQFETIILTQYVSNPRAVPVEQLTAMFRQTWDRTAISAADPLGAWNMARALAKRDDLICITGSFFLAAEVRELIRGQSFAAVRT